MNVTAARVLEIEALAVSRLKGALNAEFDNALTALASASTVVVVGMGKSGIIGMKIAATFASTGTRAFFMHPAEAFHGDLGMVAPEDVVLAISYSGETEEVLRLMPFFEDNRNYVVAMTGVAESSLARAAGACVLTAVVEEACPLQLAPTASTTACLAMGDAMAVALMELRGFSEENFARFHPGGSLGRRLLQRVGDVMVSSPLPVVNESALFMEVMEVISGGGLGLVCVRTPGKFGVITDGDLRRGLEEHGRQIFDVTASDLMTVSPHTVSRATRYADALQHMERLRISSLLVVEDSELVGIVRK
jgi:arabinose-5-phosphate isomerase